MLLVHLWIVSNKLSDCERDFTLDDLAGLNIPAQEAGVGFGDDDAGSTLLKTALRLAGAGLVGRESDEGVVQVVGLRGSNARLAKLLELLKLIALHHCEAAIFAVEDDVVHTNGDGSWGCSDQSSAGSESEDL